MRRCLFILASCFAAFLFVSQQTWAATLASHRAVYKLVLDSARSASSVADVNGKMIFEWKDSCEAWTTNQKFQLHFFYKEGEEVKLGTDFVSWETKDGSSYRFYTRKTTNGEIEEIISGQVLARGKGKPGVVQFYQPQKKKLKLNSDVLLPTFHTLEVLKHADADDKTLDRFVFDGSETDGPVEINTLILRAGSTNESVKNDAHLVTGKKGWKVRMAFYPVSAKEDTPDYEATATLLENGIWTDLIFDYGEFRVKALLQKVEALPAGKC